MDPDTSKWEKIATKVDAALVGQPHIHRNGPACKYKWQSMLQEFKKLADFHKETGRRSLDYFSITAQEKMAHKLPKNFYLEVYTCMNEWLQHKPSINPPHARDTLHPSDGNYEGREAFVAANAQFAHNCGSEDTGGDDDDCHIDAALENHRGLPRVREREGPQCSTPDSAEEVWGDGELPQGNRTSSAFPQGALPTASTMNIGRGRCSSPVTHMQPSDPVDFNAVLPSPQLQSEQPRAGANTASHEHGSGTPVRAPSGGFSAAPNVPGNAPTATAAGSGHRHGYRGTGNSRGVSSGDCLGGNSPHAPRRQHVPTGPAVPGGAPHINLSSSTSRSDLRRNTLAHAVMAEATAESSDKLVQGLKEINTTTREMEQSKIKIQMKIFTEDMAYRRDGLQEGLQEGPSEHGLQEGPRSPVFGEHQIIFA
jgi:hypothetical protein